MTAAAPAHDPWSVCIVGVGVRGASVLERLGAHLAETSIARPLRIHLVDPFPPGAGTVWRVEQAAELLMNTASGNTTIFVDDSVETPGPRRPGPTLREWCHLVAAAYHGRAPEGVRAEIAHVFDGWPVPEGLSDGPLAAQVEAGGSDDWYPSRSLYGYYLRWCVEWSIAELAPEVETVWHAARAVDCRRLPDGRQEVVLSEGAPIHADAVVLAPGWLAAEPAPDDDRIARLAGTGGTLWIPPAQPNDQDLTGIRAGEPVIVRGFAMSFFDIMALLTLGRGGQFDNHDGDPTRLRYVASGDEPVLHVGSRRGVPVRSKPFGGNPQFRADHRHLLSLLSQPRPEGGWDMEDHILPLVRKDALWNYYATLARVAPASVTDLDALAEALDRSPADSPELAALLAELVPIAADRLDLQALEGPAGRTFQAPGDYDAWLIAQLAADFDESHRGSDSPTKAAARAIGDSRKRIAPLAEFGGLTARSYRGPYQRLSSWGAYLDGGPPAIRAAQLIALIEAGIVHAVGPRTVVDHDGDAFVAESADVAGSAVRARVLLDARVDWPAATGTGDPLIRNLLASGRARPHRVGDERDHVETGGIDVDPRSRILTADGPDDALHLVGIPAEGPRVYTVLSPTYGGNSAVLRETDDVAAQIVARFRAPDASDDTPRQGVMSA